MSKSQIPKAKSQGLLRGNDVLGVGPWDLGFFFMHPPHELFPFHHFQFGNLHYLAAGDRADEPGATAGGYFSPVVIRYAYPHYATREPFFPALAVDDVGGAYRGLEALDWIMDRGLLFPRSDAVGLRADGSKDQLPLKELDLAVTPTAFCAHDATGFPGHPLTAAIQIVPRADFALAPGGGFPARLSACLPTFQLHADLIGARGLRLLPRALTLTRPLRFAEID